MSGADNNRRTNIMARTVRAKVYRFAELSKPIQDKIVTRHIEEMIQYEHEDHYENWPEYKAAMDKANQLQTPWFSASYVFDYCGKEILEILNGPEYEFTQDGRRF